jgi:hypothetical protein
MMVGEAPGGAGSVEAGGQSLVVPEP